MLPRKVSRILEISGRRLWTIASLLVILSIAVFDLRILIAPDALQVQYTPDDAYYYLVLAKNFSRMGLWTFDSGFSVTSGFHPLLAYLLAFLYTIVQPATSEYVRLGLLLSSLITVGAALTVWGLGLRQSGPYYLIFLALLIGSKNFVYNSVSVMEWSLVILFAALYGICYYHSYDSPTKKEMIILFTLGLLGSLSRSDFGLLPLSLFVASLALYHFSKNKGSVLVSFVGLSGAILGVMFIFAHNQIYTGYFLQSSAEMKAHWAQIFGADYQKSAELMPLILGIDPADQVMPILLAIPMAMMSLVFVKRALGWLAARRMLVLDLSNHQSFRALTMSVAGILCVTGYIAFYGHSGGVRPWYTANLIVPTFMLLVILVKMADARLQGVSQKFMRLGISGAVTLIVLQNALSVHYLDSSASPWPYQQIMLDAGKYLKEQHLDESVGSWNAGIIGYYQGGTVINLDGLVNDDIYAYALTNTLPAYLSQKHIRYVIDFEQMLTAENRRLKGGYDDSVFLSNLQPMKVFDDGQYAWKYMTLYRLLP